MNTQLSMQKIDISATGMLQLRNLAFENNHLHVFHTWQQLHSDEQNRALLDKYIFKSVCHATGPHLAKLLSVDSAASYVYIRDMLIKVKLLEQSMRDLKINFTQQWFEGLDLLSSYFLVHHSIATVQNILEIANTSGVQKFPNIAQSMSITQAHISLMVGELDEAEAVALKFTKKPFLMPSRAERPKMYMRILPVLAKTGHIEEYRQVLWRGLTGFYGDSVLRQRFADQARTTYRGTLRTLLRFDVPWSGRYIFLLLRLINVTGQVAFFKWIGIHKTLTIALRTQLYIQNYLSFKRPYTLKLAPKKSNPIFSIGWSSKSDKILVTRAQGGLGDLLMMVPGLKALKKRYPHKTIHFAIAQSFFPLMKSHKEFLCIDINSSDINTADYFRWIDLTDCPAARVESLQFPRVRSNRIAIFASAMGINLRRLKKSGVLPQYYVDNNESVAAEEFLSSINPMNLPVIGIQPFSADTYKNWPHTEELALELSRNAVVLIFHNEVIEGFNGINLHKIVRPIRESFALASKCSLLIAPDSSFLHLSAALDIPAVAIFGPTSGRVFTKFYQKNVKIVTPSKSDFACSPCWRNENRTCAITGDNESVCLRHISVVQVQKAIAGPMPSFSDRLKNSLQDIFW